MPHNSCICQSTIIPSVVSWPHACTLPARNFTLQTFISMTTPVIHICPMHHVVLLVLRSYLLALWQLIAKICMSLCMCLLSMCAALSGRPHRGHESSCACQYLHARICQSLIVQSSKPCSNRVAYNLVRSLPVSVPEFMQLMLNIIPQHEVQALICQDLCMSRRNVHLQGLLQVTSRALCSLIFCLF